MSSPGQSLSRQFERPPGRTAHGRLCRCASRQRAQPQGRRRQNLGGTRAYCVARARGLPTLVVDLDPQANATTVLDPAEVRFTASDVLADARSGIMAEAISPTGDPAYRWWRANRRSNIETTRPTAAPGSTGCEPP